MANTDRTRRRLIVLALAVGVFILYGLGWLTVLVLGTAAVAGVLSARALWAEWRAGRGIVRDVLDSVEKKVSGR